MTRILMVSKAVTPPWNDSSKNLVRDVATHLQRHRAVVLTQRGIDPGLARVEIEALYRPSRGHFTPPIFDNARVLLRLLAGRGCDLWHFFFAPNPRSSAACALAARVRGVPTLQTVCSAPPPGADLRALLFADLTVVLSRASEERALAAGVPASKLRRIPPAVAPLAPLAQAAAASARAAFELPAGLPLVVYPGDLEFSHAAEHMLNVHAALRHERPHRLVLACRAKTPRAVERERELRALAERLGVESSARFVGEIRAIHELLGIADVVALPAENLFAKMDLPLVLIEAMMLERAILVATGTPAAELVEGQTGIAAAPDVAALGDALSRLLVDADIRRELGARARRAALERFDPVTVAAAYEALYDELLR